MFDAILCYYFWLWSGKPWDVDGLRSFYYEKTLKKKLKKKDIDYRMYTQLKDTKKEILRRLQNF